MGLVRVVVGTEVGTWECTGVACIKCCGCSENWGGKVPGAGRCLSGGWILVLVVTVGVTVVVVVDVVVLVGVAHFVGNRSIVPHFGLFGIGEVIFISIVFSDFVGEGVLVIVGFSLVVRGVSIVLGNKASCGWRFCRVK